MVDTSAPAIPWDVESVRLTLFVPMNLAIAPEGWMRAVSGQDADSSNVKGTTRVESVTVEARAYALQVQPGRIDFVVQSGESEQPDAPLFATLGPWQDVRAGCAQSLRRWLVESAAPYIRLAVGLIFVRSQPDHTAAYADLQRILPALSLDGARCSDFLYQINRWAMLSQPIQGLKVNRLAQWSAMRKVRMGLRVESAGLVPVPAPRSVGVATRLLLDLNTDGERKDAIPAAASGALWDYFLATGEEIARRGDV